jgi:hypothetical protein
MNRRALVEHLIRKRELVLTRVMSSQSHDRFASLKNLERAEKRFLVSFLMNIVGGSYILTSEVWNLNVGDIASLPIPRLLAILFAVGILATGILAILAYLSIGLVVQRAVEIRPRD